MVGTILTFQYGEDFDRSRVEGVAEQEKGKFEGLPGLRFKLFAVDEGQRRAVNIYLWETREAADAVLTPELAAMAAGLYGAQPTVEYLDVAAIVDNSRLPIA
jgi:hypothetical protein